MNKEEGTICYHALSCTGISSTYQRKKKKKTNQEKSEEQNIQNREGKEMNERRERILQRGSLVAIEVSISAGDIVVDHGNALVITYLFIISS